MLTEAGCSSVFLSEWGASHLHRERVLRYIVVEHDAMDAHLIDVDVECELVNPRHSRLPSRVQAIEFTTAAAVALDGEALPENGSAWLG